MWVYQMNGLVREPGQSPYRFYIFSGKGPLTKVRQKRDFINKVVQKLKFPNNFIVFRYYSGIKE